MPLFFWGSLNFMSVILDCKKKGEKSIAGALHKLLLTEAEHFLM
jgi:hypothetical protein